MRIIDARVKYNLYLYSPYFDKWVCYLHIPVKLPRPPAPSEGFTASEVFTGNFADVICLNFKQYGACYFMLQQVK